MMTDAPHPLFNHLVLEKILKYLSFSDKKSFRLTCDFWNKIATPHFIELAEVYLEGNGLEQYLDKISKEPDKYRDGRVAVTKFENYVIKINSFLSGIDTVTTLWSIIHTYIQTLTLHITTAYARKELSWLLLHNLPLLEKIKIFIVKYWGTSDVQVQEVTTAPIGGTEETRIGVNQHLKFFQVTYLGSMSLYGYNESEGEAFVLPIAWRLFFRRFPQLMHIGLIGLCPSDVSDILDALEVARSSGGAISLNSLEILDENVFPQTPNDEHINLLSTLPGKFESLHLEVSPLATASIFHNLLEKQANFIRNLRLRRYPYPYVRDPPVTLDIHLPVVRFLEISDYLVPSLSFLQHLPSLHTLNIILRDYHSLSCCEMVQNTPNPSRLTHSGVKSVYIEPPLISKECIRKLSACFPNLEKLKLRVNDEMMQEICSQAGANSTSWKCLTNLFVTAWDGLTDEGITGINKEVLRLWGGYSSFEAQKYRMKPYIGNIVGLTTLTIEMWSDYENQLSDWSIFYGIVDLVNLQEITLIRCDVSSAAFKAIPVPVQKKFMVSC